MSFKNKKGQLIVEYILLLVASVVFALILIRFVKVQDQDGILFEKWDGAIKEVAQDIST